MELKVQERTVFGKKTKQLRREGLIPAELFGHGIENRHFAVVAKDFSRVFKEAGENTIVTLVSETGEKFPVIISDVGQNRLSNTIIAIDFHHIRKGEKIQTKVPIEFVGDAPAVKKGLLLVKVTDEVEVEALPEHIPHRFEVDLSHLVDASQSIALHDLAISNNVKVITPLESIIVTVAEPAKEKEETPATTLENQNANKTPAAEAKKE